MRKLFSLPRLVLHRSSRGGMLSTKTLQERLHWNARGEWLQFGSSGVPCEAVGGSVPIKQRLLSVEESAPR